MFEIFLGVNMLGALLQFLLASAFLTGGFGDASILLVLRARNGCAETREAQNNSGAAKRVGRKILPSLSDGWRTWGRLGQSAT